MSNRRKIIPAILAVVLVAAAVLAGLRWFRGGENASVRFSGNIELTEVDIAFKVPGRVAMLRVKEGDWVKQGDIIARLDTVQLERQKDRLVATEQAAQSRYQQTSTAILVQTETVEGQLEQRQAELRNAEAALKELLAGARSQDIEQARAAVDRAVSEFETAERDWKRAEVLFRNEDISAAAHDQAKARHDTAAAALRQARERLELLEEGARPETIEAARAQVQRAKAGVRLAEAARLDLKRTQEELNVRKAEIGQVRAEQGVIDSQLSDGTVSAPIEGVVMVKSVEEGEVIAAGTTLATIGDIRHPWLRGYIGERDLGRVKLGGKVRVTTDSHPRKVYQGRISYISPEAEFTPKQVQTPEERVKLVYRIKVDVDNPDGELKLNMPADGEVVF